VVEVPAGSGRRAGLLCHDRAVRRRVGGASRAGIAARRLVTVVVSVGAGVVVGMVVGGCGGREVTMPAIEAVPAPTFATLPDDLAASPQLAAIPQRNTAGLVPDVEEVAAALLPAALDHAAALTPPPREFVRVSVYDRNVLLEWRDPTTAGRQVSAGYDTDGRFFVSEPRFGEDEPFSMADVDLAVPVRLVEAIERRTPTARVTSLDLRVGLSYGFGLVWYVQLTDARGTLATVFADLHGAIVAVDAW
jgi:hypothetical protein